MKDNVKRQVVDSFLLVETTQWWKEVGIELPPTLSNTCNGWLPSTKEKGYFSNIPKQGAILYRGSRKW